MLYYMRPLQWIAMTITRLTHHTRLSYQLMFPFVTTSVSVCACVCVTFQKGTRHVTPVTDDPSHVVASGLLLRNAHARMLII